MYKRISELKLFMIWIIFVFALVINLFLTIMYLFIAFEINTINSYLITYLLVSTALILAIMVNRVNKFPFGIIKPRDNLYPQKIKNHKCWFCGEDKVNSFVNYEYCSEKCPYQKEVFECQELPEID
jgi:hypothetical protein